MAIIVSRGLIKSDFFKVMQMWNILQEKNPSKLLTCLFLNASTYTLKLLTTPISFVCRVQLSLCFSLSEPQHLRKTHQCRQYDDVIRWEPAASKPVHRWQCCTSKPHFKPRQPSSPELWHTYFEFMESHWITSIIDSCVFLLVFVLSVPQRFAHEKKTKNKVNIEVGHIDSGLTSAPSHLKRALLKISQYSCQSADQSVNKVSFLECFPLSPISKWRTVEGLKASDKIHRWLSLKGEMELSHHLRLCPSGSLRVTWSKCNPLKVLADSLVHAAVPLPWNIALVSTLCSPQPCRCFDCCNALRTGRVNKNERGLKREHESERERGRRAYYWPLIGYGESTPSFCVACSQPIGCPNNILGLWMKWIVREQDRSSLIHHP